MITNLVVASLKKKGLNESIPFYYEKQVLLVFNKT
jgi:hypothetical protein